MTRLFKPYRVCRTPCKAFLYAVMGKVWLVWKGEGNMKLNAFQLDLIFEKNPELKKLIEKNMPSGYNAFLIFREDQGKKSPVISFRSDG